MTALCFSPDSQRLYTIDVEGHLREWDLESRTQLSQREVPRDAVSLHAYRANDRECLLFTTDVDLPISLRHQTLLDSLDRQGERGLYQCVPGIDTSVESIAKGINMFALSARATRMVACNAASQWVRVYALPDLELLAEFHHPHVVEAALTPDGSSVVTKSYNALLIWDVERRALLKHWLHETNISSFALSPDGAQVAVASHDHSVRILDLQTLAELARLTHDGAVFLLRFGPDGRYLATVSDGSLVRAWVWSRTDLLEESRVRLCRNASFSEWQLYVGTEPYHRTSPHAPLHPSWLDEAALLARSGERERARSLLLSCTTQHAELEIDPEEWLDRVVAEAPHLSVK